MYGVLLLGFTRKTWLGKCVGITCATGITIYDYECGRFFVKIDPTTGNSDIVAFAMRSNTKNMKTLATVVNSECDTKVKIEPNTY